MMKNKSLKLFALAAMAVLLAATEAEAQLIYKCRNAAGKLEISDAPCKADSKTEGIRDGSPTSVERRQEATAIASRNSSTLAQQEAARRPPPQASTGNPACDKLAAGYRGDKMGDVTKMMMACNPSATQEMMRPQKRPCAHAQDIDCVKTTHY